jgi:hypothetical protein
MTMEIERDVARMETGCAHDTTKGGTFDAMATYAQERIETFSVAKMVIISTLLALIFVPTMLSSERFYQTIYCWYSYVCFWLIAFLAYNLVSCEYYAQRVRLWRGFRLECLHPFEYASVRNTARIMYMICPWPYAIEDIYICLAAMHRERLFKTMCENTSSVSLLDEKNRSILGEGVFVRRCVCGGMSEDFLRV